MLEPATIDESPAPSPPGRMVAVIAAFVFATVAIFMFSPALSSPWLYDDYWAIVQNHHVRTLWPLSVPLSAEQESPFVDRPVVSLTIAINYALAGGTGNPFPYRMTNLAIHVFNALLLFGLIRWTFSLPRVPQAWRQASGAIGFSVALLWLVHPFSTEPVIYVTQRTELLLATFMLLTLYAFVRGAVSRSAVRRAAWMLLCVVSCALGMASKEVMVGAPLIVLLVDRAYVSGSFAAALKRHRWAYVGLLATWGLLAVLVFTEPTRTQTAGFDQRIGVWDYLRIQAGVLVHYAKLVFYSGDLNVHYEWPVPHALTAWLPQGIAVVVAVVVAVVAAIKWPLWGTPALAVFVVLAPTSSFLPIETEVGTDRRMYIPAAFVLLLCAAVAYVLFKRRVPRVAPRAVVALSLAAGGYFGVQSYLRAEQWSDPIGIWADSFAKTPDDPVAHHNYAYEVLARSEGSADKVDEAIRHFEKAIELEPRYASAHANVAAAYIEQGKLDVAMTHVRKAIQLDPTLVDGYTNLGVLLSMAGDQQRALAAYDKALSLDASNALTHFNRADTLYHLGRIDEGIAAMQRALSLGLDKKRPEALMRLGDLYAKRGDATAAMRYYQQALEARPEFPTVLFQMGMLRAGQNDDKGAQKFFEKAIEQDPMNATAYFNLAMSYARMQQWSKATAALETVLRLQPDFADAKLQLERVKAIQQRGGDGAQ